MNNTYLGIQTTNFHKKLRLPTAHYSPRTPPNNQCRSIKYINEGIITNTIHRQKPVESAQSVLQSGSKYNSFSPMVKTKPPSYALLIRGNYLGRQFSRPLSAVNREKKSPSVTCVCLRTDKLPTTT